MKSTVGHGAGRRNVMQSNITLAELRRWCELARSTALAFPREMADGFADRSMIEILAWEYKLQQEN